MPLVWSRSAHGAPLIGIPHLKIGSYCEIKWSFLHMVCSISKTLKYGPKSRYQSVLGDLEVGIESTQTYPKHLHKIKNDQSWSQSSHVRIIQTQSWQAKCHTSSRFAISWKLLGQGLSFGPYNPNHARFDDMGKLTWSMTCISVLRNCIKPVLTCTSYRFTYTTVDTVCVYI